MASNDLFAAPLRHPATRTGDHQTSVEAADKAAVTQRTIRGAVLAYGAAAGREGFIDDDLVEARGGQGPESSWRKRRGELVEEGYLIDSGRTRLNHFGNKEIVWVHRNFVVDAPPIKERPKPVDSVEARQKVEDRKALADELAKCADSLHREGRAWLAALLIRAAEALR